MKLVSSGKDTYVYTNNKTVDPTKPSLVFIHGAGFDHSVWTFICTTFFTS
jgi:pimeloyl-ACP methyl ester carboxylesterase